MKVEGERMKAFEKRCESARREDLPSLFAELKKMGVGPETYTAPAFFVDAVNRLGVSGDSVMLQAVAEMVVQHPEYTFAGKDGQTYENPRFKRMLCNIERAKEACRKRGKIQAAETMPVLDMLWPAAGD